MRVDATPELTSDNQGGPAIGYPLGTPNTLYISGLFHRGIFG